MMLGRTPKLSKSFLNWPNEWRGFTPPQAEGATHWNWKVPYESDTVAPDSPVTLRKQAIEVLLQCLVVAAEEARGKNYEVAALITWPNVHGSEITAFFDPAYADEFRPARYRGLNWSNIAVYNDPESLGAYIPLDHNLFEKLAISIPEGFEAAGVRSVGVGYDPYHYHNEEHWTVMETVA